MPWSTAAARERFADLVRAANEEPQPIYSRDRLVAVVIDPVTWHEFESWRASRSTIADDLAAIRLVAAEEDWSLEVPYRADRPSAFDDDAG